MSGSCSCGQAWVAAKAAKRCWGLPGPSQVPWQVDSLALRAFLPHPSRLLCPRWLAHTCPCPGPDPAECTTSFQMMWLKPRAKCDVPNCDDSMLFSSLVPATRWAWSGCCRHVGCRELGSRRPGQGQSAFGVCGAEQRVLAEVPGTPVRVPDAPALTAVARTFEQVKVLIPEPLPNRNWWVDISSHLF